MHLGCCSTFGKRKNTLALADTTKLNAMKYNINFLYLKKSVILERLP